MYTSSQAWPPRCWHVLAESSVPAAEFARALSHLGPVTSWVPQMSLLGLAQTWTRREPCLESPTLTRIHFPLQRGYTRLPFELSTAAFRRTLAMLTAHTDDPTRSVLICTSSFWAPVAALWPGPVVYYATDLTIAYDGLSAPQVLAADRALCSIATLVCPNSARLADFFTRDAGCDPKRILILPNATRAANLRSHPFAAATSPPDIAHLPHPLAGVIGNMGNNIDWPLVAATIEATPDLHWLFVGPTEVPALTAENRAARASVMLKQRAHFVGPRPYAELFRYARAIDAAVMPYNRIEPTFSGSATRFYEHLAAARPMFATRGVEELLHKEPLLTLVDNAADLANRLRKLCANAGSFVTDGMESNRCQAARTETWEARAHTLCNALERRFEPQSPSQPAPNLGKRLYPRSFLQCG